MGFSIATVPKSSHGFAVNATIQLDGSNRVRLSRDLLRAAGFSAGDTLKISATPGRIVLEVQPNRGTVIRRGKLKVWTGAVPTIPLAEAVDAIRRYKQ